MLKIIEGKKIRERRAVLKFRRKDGLLANGGPLSKKERKINKLRKKSVGISGWSEYVVHVCEIFFVLILIK